MQLGDMSCLFVQLSMMYFDRKCFVQYLKAHFMDTAAILNSIVSHVYYGMLRGQIPIISIETLEFKMAAISTQRAHINNSSHFNRATSFSC